MAAIGINNIYYPQLRLITNTIIQQNILWIFSSIIREYNQKIVLLLTKYLFY